MQTALAAAHGKLICQQQSLQYSYRFTVSAAITPIMYLHATAQASSLRSVRHSRFRLSKIPHDCILSAAQSVGLSCALPTCKERHQCLVQRLMQHSATQFNPHDTGETKGTKAPGSAQGVSIGSLSGIMSPFSLLKVSTSIIAASLHARHGCPVMPEASAV